MDVRVRGAGDFFDLAQACRAAARHDLDAELNAGLNRSVKPMQQAIHAEAEKVMPSRGGYQAVLTAALRVKPTRSARAGTIRLVVSAKGKTEDRDVRKLNAGQLRHPNPPGRSRRVRGRWVPNDWSVTRIRSGFVYRPFDATAPAVVKELGQALDNVAKKIAGG